MDNFRTNIWADDEDQAASSSPVGSPDFVAHQLVRGLYAGRYVAGQRLIESELTREFKVSRGTVREALRRLAAEGVISITMHTGACIRAFTKAEVLDVIRVFEVLLVLAVTQAAHRAAAGEPVRELKRTLDALAAVPADADYFELVGRQNAMYRALVIMSGNREILRAIPALNMHFIRNHYRALSPRLARDRLAEFRTIVKAISDGNAELAAATASAHVKKAAIQLETLPAEAYAAFTTSEKQLLSR